MQILALETTEAIGSLAALSCGKLLAQKDLDPAIRSAQSLAPGMKSLLDQLGWRSGDVQLVAVTTGPGSFTGIRVGVATAKTFAYAIGAEVLGIDTLRVIANGVPNDIACVACAVDAQRGDVVVNEFTRAASGELVPVGPNRLLDADAWLASLPQGMAIAGPVLGKLVQRLPEHVLVIDEQFWRPKAAVVAHLAEQDYLAGRRQDIWSLLPVYSRRCAAEEKQTPKAADSV